MAFEHSPWQTSLRFTAQAKDELTKKRDYAAELGALGYPQFSYLKKKKPSAPGKLLFDALDESELDSRIAEGLPWLARTAESSLQSSPVVLPPGVRGVLVTAMWSLSNEQ